MIINQIVYIFVGDYIQTPIPIANISKDPEVCGWNMYMKIVGGTTALPGV